jgi:3-oxoacyl-[acyl-carrier-protein] synthase I
VMRLHPLSITDYSLCTPLGPDRERTTAALREGRTGLVAPPFPLPFRTMTGTVAFELPSLPEHLRGYDGRPARMAAHLVAALEPSLARARERWSPERIGVILGTSTAGARATEVAYDAYVTTGVLPLSYDFRRQHGYGAIVDVVKALSGVSGPGWVLSTTCTSSAKPLGTAMRMVAAGLIDAAIVGGLDTLCRVTITGFRSLDALSDERCRPFSAERKGINIGEGGAFLLVERKGDARALLEGVGESSDAYHISAPHPEGEGAACAMERALEQAGCRPTDVDAVNAHGTGTRLNDLAEGKALGRLFGPEIPVVSTKSFTGHALGGAGAMEAGFSLLSLEGGWLPPNLGAEPIDPRLQLNVPTKETRGRFRRILSNSFAFGGNNVCVLLRSV